MNTDVSFGLMLRRLRRGAFLTQEQVAKRSSLSVRAIRNLEADRTRPRQHTVLQLCEALGLQEEHRALLMVAADERATSPVPRQLPVSATPFSGRATELSVLDALASGVDAAADTGSVRIALITGMPGVGKTALAVRFAHRAAARYPDGQVYVDLQGFADHPASRPAEVLAQFLRAFGVDPAALPADVRERAALLRTTLSGRRVLMVLDNAASVEQVDALLPASASALVVVTSRLRLDGLLTHHGALHLPVRPLPPGDAVELLTQVLGDSRVAGESAAAQQLAAVCGHLPLALRLAGAALLVQPFRSIGEAVEMLAGTAQLSGLTASADGSPTVRTAFAASFARLDPLERDVFERLALAPGRDISLSTVAVLADRAPAAVAAILDRLVAYHLVEQQTTRRYRLHDLLRTYALEQRAVRDPADERAAITRLLDHYIATTDAAGRFLAPQLLRMPDLAAGGASFDDEEQPLQWLEAERPNLVAAVSEAAHRSIHGRACRLVDAMRAFLTVRSYHDDWLVLAETGLGAAITEADDVGTAAMRMSLAQLHWSRADYPAARAGYEAALELFPGCHWPEGEAAAVGNLAGVCRNLGELDRAEELYLRTLHSNRTIGSTRGEALTLANLASLAIDRGLFSQAIELAGVAFERYERAGSRHGKARQLQTQGLAWLELGALERARTCLEEALGEHRAIGIRDGEADCLDKLARVARDIGDLNRAATIVDEALKISSAIGDRGTEAEALSTRSSIRLAMGDVDGALHDAVTARDTASGAGYLLGESEALVRITEAAVRRGDADAALAAAEGAAVLNRRAGATLIEGSVALAMARARLAAHDPAGARDHADRALRVFDDRGQQAGARHARLLLDRISGLPNGRKYR